MMGISMILAATVAFFPFAWAQTGSGNSAMVRGTVRAADGRAPVANARVVAISDSDIEVARTDSDGNFYFFSLIPGDYRLAAEKEGFASACAQDRDQELNELSAGMEYSASITLSKRC